MRCDCGQSLYAIKVLCCHGMNEEELRLVYKSVVLANLMYASPAWWGFATAVDKKRLRHRRHNLSLSVKHDDRNFVTRQLFKDAY